MDKIQVALVLWSFLFGLIVGLYLGQKEVVRELIGNWKLFNKKEEVDEEKQTEQIVKEIEEIGADK